MKIREYGMTIGHLPTGVHNCITDVEGVAVGHETIREDLEDGEVIRTGVTAILPHDGNLFREKVIGASHVINGFGKTAGLVQVDELGTIESPIMLTNTLAVGTVLQSTVKEMLTQSPEIGDTTGTVNVVVGECNDGHLNTIRHIAVREEHVQRVLQNASTTRAEEGAVGAGTGMVCFGHKGGIGSSSRCTDHYTVGVLVLSNFGKEQDFEYARYKGRHTEEAIAETDGSIIIVLATDAPVTQRQLKRIIQRCSIGLGKTGAYFSNGSGDITIGFSTAHRIPHQSDEKIALHVLRDDEEEMYQLFKAAAEATEEAILNSLAQAETTTGRKGRIVEAYPFRK
ncbi:MAG TPA: P1 family peptidase [Savagea sp.]